MNNKRAAHSQFTHIKDVIAEILTKCRVSPDAELIEIQTLWKHRVGSMVADHAVPVSCKKGVLFVQVKSPALIQQLRYQVKDILMHINQELGVNKLSEIRFKIR
jgi:predicted nucleic acid-binding Zn ribbon protein